MRGSCDVGEDLWIQIKNVIDDNMSFVYGKSREDGIDAVEIETWGVPECGGGGRGGSGGRMVLILKLTCQFFIVPVH